MLAARGPCWNYNVNARLVQLASAPWVQIEKGYSTRQANFLSFGRDGIELRGCYLDPDSNGKMRPGKDSEIVRCIANVKNAVGGLSILNMFYFPIQMVNDLSDALAFVQKN